MKYKHSEIYHVRRSIGAILLRTVISQSLAYLKQLYVRSHSRIRNRIGCLTSGSSRFRSSWIPKSQPGDHHSTGLISRISTTSRRQKVGETRSHGMMSQRLSRIPLNDSVSLKLSVQCSQESERNTTAKSSITASVRSSRIKE